MDKIDKVLVAIEQLAQNLTGQIAAVDTKLSREIAAVRADVTTLQANFSVLQANVAVLQADVVTLKIGQAQILEHLDVAELKGRLEEQSRTIASLIPTKLAAVAKQ